MNILKKMPSKNKKIFKSRLKNNFRLQMTNNALN